MPLRGSLPGKQFTGGFDMAATHIKRTFTITLALSFISLSQQSLAQTSQQAEQQVASPVCDQPRALLLVKQQVDESKTLDQLVARITVLIRAADLLWPYERERARAVFTEAFELATQYFRQRGDEARIEKSLYVLLPDQRFRVLTAIARRDPEWAKRLAQTLAEESARDAEKTAQPATGISDIGEKLIGMALPLLEVDRQTAINFARSSLRYPAASTLPLFLFKLAEADRAAADRFFLEALAAYAEREMRGLYYLSVYPFALNDAISLVRPSMYYNTPKNFALNSKLQEAFLKTLFARIERSLKEKSEAIESPASSPETPDYLSGLAGVYVALSKLEPLIAQNVPAYAERAATLKTSVGATLNASQQAQVAGEAQVEEDSRRELELSVEDLFEKKVEQIEKESNADKRDFLIAQVVLISLSAELERVEKLLDKVSDSKLQGQLRNWFYFRRAEKAIYDGLFDEATRLAAKVEELDHRAYLMFANVSAITKRLNDKARVHELLDEVAAAALKAPNTIEKARTLLGVAYLFTKLDPLRAAEVMSEAIKTINRLDHPDFTDSSITRAIEGRVFSMFASYNMPGINLENALRELGRTDFDGALWLSKNLEDKALRATAVLALSTPCLEKPQKQIAPTKPRQQDEKKPGKQEKPEKD
jgi:hypothetical protein